VANSHGFEEWDHLEVTTWTDVYGNTYQGDYSLDQPGDYQSADWITVAIHYPDGSVETRNFVGPFNDEDDLEQDIQEWWDSEGTP
jgi:propanediol utilization protein